MSVDVSLTRWLIETSSLEATLPAGVRHIADDEEFLSCWSEGLVGERERSEAIAHLARCAPCREAISEIWPFIAPPRAYEHETATRESKVLESFVGRVDGIENMIAHLTLVDSRGEELVADYPSEELADRGIGNGDRFRCTVLSHDDSLTMSFEVIPRIALSTEKQDAIRSEIRQALKDVDLDVDY